MEQDKLNPSVTLMGEEGASLSSGSLRLYAIPNSSFQIPNSAVGCIDLCNLDFFNHRGEISILINKDFRNKNYATSAITALCTYAKEHLQMHQLFAEILTENAASLRVFEKCGFSRSGVKKDWILQNGEYKDVALYQKTL